MTNAFLPESMYENAPNAYAEEVLIAYTKYEHDLHDSIFLLPDNTAFVLFGSQVLETTMNEEFQIVDSDNDTLKLFKDEKTAFRYITKRMNLL